MSAPAVPTVDWDLAVAAAVRLAPRPPSLDRAEAAAVVAELRDAAGRAQAHVREHTGLVAPAGDGAVLVVDRPSWIRANADAFAAVLDPLVLRLASRRKGPGASPAALAVGGALTGAEAGGLLALLSAKVLGQYEVFAPAASGGRLLLVAPNVVAVERELDVDPSDFRLWVCLHEETHRVQFAVAPWLRDHLREQLEVFIDATELDAAAALRRLWAVLRAVVSAVRGTPGASLVEAVQSDAQRAALARVTAVMSLLEGHADVVMDDVGPQVVPSVAQIRERFQRRRESTSLQDSAVRRLLGLEAKMRQYREGAVFVRGVLDAVGMEGFNRVWESPETLPRPEEIADPAAWVARVHAA
ncbi:putative hydrolase/coenzyme F420 biosynthesis associated uncharacterized protein [Motilibacter rhizosphaerae]|uniref:Putative hydrolase/coenzyme F420 biosynthesis associated uncharacterized protein n=1 Tax=Motilibacter rhizosphaerae TaxID=598652 RepID=A0A4V2F2S0_9ACTN|nr:zinc-dependent metalloprotease [Motilibacter rhizosphaerae]RZS79426.1 putative hydrolase/coenzyme F420 biosynthesis associated uncharacterized protein [Motilibacter rhizosphaerae]